MRRELLESVMATSIRWKESENPLCLRGFVASSNRLAWCCYQEEIVIEAASPTHMAVMLQSRQQRRQALRVMGFMTDLKINDRGYQCQPCLSQAAM